MENGRISLQQFAVLVIMYTLGSSILVEPSIFAMYAKQDAWIATAFGLVLMALLVMLYAALGDRFPQKTLAEYNEILFGKWLGKAVCLLYFSFFFMGTGSILREIGTFITTQLMPETPIESIEILLFSTVIMAVRLGLEVVARAAEIFFPWVVILFLFLVAAVMPEIHIENLQPVFEGGVKPILKGVIPFLASPARELVILLMIVPFVQRSKGIGKVFLTGSLIGGAGIMILSFLTILVLGNGINRHSELSELRFGEENKHWRFFGTAGIGDGRDLVFEHLF